MGCYDQPGPCAAGPPPGSLALVGWWTRNYQLPNYGICNCRPVRGGTTPSMHGPCRAADLAANYFDPAMRAKMEDALAWLIANHVELGVQYIIWNRRSWHCERGWRDYTGVSPHRDHAHVELTEEGAATASPLWLGGAPETGGFLMALDPKLQEELFHNSTLLPNINHELGQVKAAVRDEGRLVRAQAAELAGKPVKLDKATEAALARSIVTDLEAQDWEVVLADLGDDDVQRIAEAVNDDLAKRLSRDD